MSLGAISFALDLADKIQTQTEKLKQNKSQLRELSKQAVAIVNDIREHYAELDEQRVELPPAISDSLSEMELLLAKILKLIEKERQRSAFKAWIKASEQAGVCADISDELSRCASRFNMAASVHILGQTRVIVMKQESIAARDEGLLHAIIEQTRPGATDLYVQSETTVRLEGGHEQVKTEVAYYSNLGSSSGNSSSSSITGANVYFNGAACFQAFVECLESASSPSDELSPSLHEAFTFFFRHVESRHTGLNICYAATETFVIEYEDELKVLGCVAVLKEEYDRRPNYDDRGGNVARCRRDFIFEFTLLEVSDHSSSPSDWIQVQGLADYFHKERICFALWDLGRLPPASHLPDSESFRWIKQSISRIPTKDGSKVVVDVESGNATQPFRRFHQLNARIAHPSNSAYRLDLIKHMDREIRTVCEETNEEWFIALIGQLQLIPSLEGRRKYLKAHQTYAFEAIKLEIDAFYSMGVLRPLPTGAENPLESEETFQQLQDDAFSAITNLFEPLMTQAADFKPSKLLSSYVTSEDLKLARCVGKAWYRIHTSIVLLTPEGREQSSNFTRIPLAKLRRDLAEEARPLPALIWNYVPPHLTARARHRRAKLLEKA